MSKQIDKLLSKATKAKTKPHWCIDHQQWETKKHDTVEPFKNWVEKQTSSYSQGGRVRTTREGSFDATVPHPSTTRAESQAEPAPFNPHVKGDPYSEQPNAELQALIDIFPAALAAQEKRRAEAKEARLAAMSGDVVPLTPTDENIQRGRSDTWKFATPYPFDPTSERTTQGGAVKTTREEKLRYGNKSLEKALLKLMKDEPINTDMFRSKKLPPPVKENEKPLDMRNPANVIRANPNMLGHIPPEAVKNADSDYHWARYEHGDMVSPGGDEAESVSDSYPTADTVQHLESKYAHLHPNPTQEYLDAIRAGDVKKALLKLMKQGNGEEWDPDTQNPPIPSVAYMRQQEGRGGKWGPDWRTSDMTQREMRANAQALVDTIRYSDQQTEPQYRALRNSIEKTLIKLMKQGEEDEFKIPKPIQPSDKSPQMDQDLKDVFGVDRRQSIKSGACTMCKGEADKFRDDLSRKEYGISGMCQDCQDNIFGGAE